MRRFQAPHLGGALYRPIGRRLACVGASRHCSGAPCAAPRRVPQHLRRAPDASIAKAVQVAESVAVAASVVAAAKHRRRTFATRKENFLRKPDKSPKGSIDDRVLELCGEINRSEAFFTTSSCSGRCFLWQGRHHGGAREDMDLEPSPALGIVEGSGSFVRFRVSHDLVEDLAAFDPTVAPGQGPVWLSLQGFQLDVCCRELAAAWRLLRLASGVFENARLYTWKEGRWMVQMDGGELLDFPLSAPDGTGLFAGQEAWLRELVNRNLESNWRNIRSLLKVVREASDMSLATEGAVDDAAQVSFGTRPDTCGLPAPADELRGSMDQLVAELDTWPDLRVTAARSGRTCLLVERPDGTSEQRRVGHGLLEDTSCFDAAGLAAEAGEGSACWFRLEPIFLRVWCRDLAAASALIAAAGTSFKKPGLTLRDGGCVLEILGGERMEVPLVTPDGSRPYEGREDWLRELVNGDLQKSWAKTSHFLEEVKATPSEVAEASWGRRG